jgi:hypothetical protein
VLSRTVLLAEATLTEADDTFFFLLTLDFSVVPSWNPLSPGSKSRDPSAGYQLRSENLCDSLQSETNIGQEARLGKLLS